MIVISHKQPVKILVAKVARKIINEEDKKRSVGASSPCMYESSYDMRSCLDECCFFLLQTI